MKQNALDVLKERGFLQQITDEEAVRDLFDKGAAHVYVGVDPTADSLHAGSLFPLMALANLERLGHRPIVILGGGTAMVGDPSGKTEMRRLLSAEQLASNTERIRQQVGKILDIEGGKTLVLNNLEWLADIKYIEFLRDVGVHFSVNRMLSAEGYRIRMERGLSFIEFNYQLLQAYDFLQLARHHDCRIQMGGDDQWGNILAGVDLCRRMDQRQTHGITWPLLLNANGEKMGKTAGGAVWLAEDRLASYEYYQYWVNTQDADLVRLLGAFTFLPMSEIRAVQDLKGVLLNQAKSVLAYEATRLLHGPTAADEAHQAALSAFGSRAIDAAILPASKVPRMAAGDAAQIPTLALTAAEVDSGAPIIEVLVRAGLCVSKSDARRKLREGAVRIQERVLSDDKYMISKDDFEGREALLRLGKKKVHRLKQP